MFFKNFAKFTGKTCVAVKFRPATLLKTDHNTSVFLWLLQNFKNNYFKEHLHRVPFELILGIDCLGLCFGLSWISNIRKIPVVFKSELFVMKNLFDSMSLLSIIIVLQRALLESSSAGWRASLWSPFCISGKRGCLFFLLGIYLDKYK